MSFLGNIFSGIGHIFQPQQVNPNPAPQPQQAPRPQVNISQLMQSLQNQQGTGRQAILGGFNPPTPQVHQPGLQPMDVIKGIPQAFGINSGIDLARFGLSDVSKSVADLTHNKVAAQNAQAAKDAAIKRLAGNVPNVLPVAIAEGVKPFAQSVATAALSGQTEKLARQEADRANRLLTPVYEKQAQAMGYAPGVGTSLAQQEAGKIYQNFIQSQMAKAGIAPTDAGGQITRKVGGQAAQAGANILMAGELPGISGSLAKTVPTFGGLSALQAIGGVAQQDNPTGRDYLTQGFQAGLQGAALPIAFHGAAAGLRGIGNAIDNIPGVYAAGHEPVPGEAPQVGKTQTAPGTAVKEDLTLYRGNNKVNTANANSDRPVFHTDSKEYASTYGDVTSKKVSGNVVTADSIHAYENGVVSKLGAAIGKYVNARMKAGQMTGIEEHELRSWLNDALHGESLSAQFRKPMSEDVKKAFNDIGVDYIRIPGDQFKGTVGKIGHQTEIIEIPKPKATPAPQVGKTAETATPPPQAKVPVGNIPGVSADGPPQTNLPLQEPLSAQQGKSLVKQITKEPTVAPDGTTPLGLVDTIKNSPLTSVDLNNLIGGKHNPLGNKQTLLSAQDRISTDPLAAHQYAMNNHNAEANATAVLLAKQYEAAGKPEAAASLMITKAQQALEAGQGNQIYALWNKLSPETVAQTAAKTIEKYNQTAKKPISQLSPEQYQSFVDQAKKIQSLPEGSRAQNIASQKLMEQIGKLIPSSGSDKAFALWRTGLLTGFRTPGKILVSHGVSNLFEQAKNVPAAIADKAISLGTGERGLSLTPKGNIAGGLKGTLAAVDNLFTGYDAPGSGGFPKDYLNSTNFGNSLHGKIAQGYVDTISRLHGSLYKPFYGAQHLNSLIDMATTNAKNSDLTGAAKSRYIQDFVKQATDYATKNTEANPKANFSTPEGAALRANAEAQYTTFQNKTKLSEIASAAKQGKGNPTKVIAPFTQIPSSIAMKIVDYSPVGPIKEAIQQVHNGTFDQRSLSQAIGRGATGTGLMALGNQLFNKGMLTTSYPADKKTQAQWQLEGKQENSILVGGKWRKLSSLGPAGDAISVGANFAEGMVGNKKTPGSLSNAGLKAGIGGLGVIGQSPYLQGLDSLSGALKDPQGKTMGLVKSLGGSIVPTGVSNLAAATDPLQRQTNTVGDVLKNNIPGLRETSLPKVNVLGNNVPRAQGAVGTLFDPFYSTTAKSNPVINELGRLNAGGTSATPTPLTKDQTILGQKVTLNPAQLTDLQQQSGQPIDKQFAQLMATPEYKGATDATKQKALETITTNVRDSIKTGVGTGQITNSNSLVDLNKLTKQAQLTLAKDNFDKSGSNYQVVGDTVLRRDAQGNITATPKVTFDYQVGQQTLIDRKNAGDLSGWMKTAQSQIDSIKTQLQDPSVDPLDKLKLQNEATAIMTDAAKYQSYGGFTKGKGGSGAKLALAGVPKIPKIKSPKAPSIKMGRTKTTKFASVKFAKPRRIRVK